MPNKMYGHNLHHPTLPPQPLRPTLTLRTQHNEPIRAPDQINKATAHRLSLRRCNTTSHQSNAQVTYGQATTTTIPTTILQAATLPTKLTHCHNTLACRVRVTTLWATMAAKSHMKRSSSAWQQQQKVQSAATRASHEQATASTNPMTMQTKTPPNTHLISHTPASGGRVKLLGKMKRTM